MSEPRLAIVHTENSCGWGGQEVRILTEARGFLDRGHRVTLLAPPEAPIVPAAARLGVPVETLALRRKRPRDLLALRAWLARHAGEVDVLNTHSSTDSWLGALACATIAHAPPIVRTRHVSTTVHDRAATRWLYRHGNAHIVTTGEAVRSQLARDLAVPLERMTSVPTGIDLARFVPGHAGLARERLGLAPLPTLGIMATLRAWKGHTFLFDALAADAPRWRGWQVLVVGGGPDREPLERYVERAGLSAWVRFTGHQEDVVPWLQALDLFVLPSYGEEGVPQAIMQAMACGIAVVSTDVGGIAEAVVDGATGVLVAPRSATALGAALATLREDSALRTRYGAEGRRRAEERFGDERMIERMEAVFRAVIAARSR